MSWIDGKGKRHDEEPKPGLIKQAAQSETTTGLARLSMIAAAAALPFAGVLAGWFAITALGKLDTVVRQQGVMGEFIAGAVERGKRRDATLEAHERALAEHGRDIGDMKTRTAILEATRRRAELPELGQP